jgi:CBS-domain-containing membrane protein
MNIAKIMIPKVVTVFLNENQTVRQGLEIITRYGYTAVPVLDANQHYMGCINEGDFLRHILAVGTTDKKALENTKVGELVRRDFCPALNIDADEKDVITSILNQNFVPIVDGRNTLCGILTRRGVIAYLAERSGASIK